MKNINGDSLRMLGTQFRATGFVSDGGVFGLEWPGLRAVRDADRRTAGIRCRVPERAFDPANRGRACVGRNNVFMRDHRTVSAAPVVVS